MRMQTKLDIIDLPVCNNFRPTIKNNHRCYEVDLSKYTYGDPETYDNLLKSGFVFIMDYNEDEDRQATLGEERLNNHKTLVSQMGFNDQLHAKIIINTIGIVCLQSRYAVFFCAKHTNKSQFNNVRQLTLYN